MNDLLEYRQRRVALKDELYSDPFQERSTPDKHRTLWVLGVRIRFESNSEELLRLVDAAYAGLPAHALSRCVTLLQVRLVLTSEPSSAPRTRSTTRGRVANAQPSSLQMMSGSSLLAGATAGSSFVVISPDNRSALVVIAPWMLRFPYHTRYELIEFAVFTLTARAQDVVAMHGACVGHAGRGVLLLGPSGAGKSTVTLQCLIEGLEILAEDSVFVTPDTLIATGVSNFLHVRADSLRWVRERRKVDRIRASPIIQRRSGVRKYEIDLRRGGYALAKRPLQITAVVFLSAAAAHRGRMLRRLPLAGALRSLVREQAYAANRPPWAEFMSRVRHLPFFELRRGTHPCESVAALRGLMAGAGSAIR